MARGVQKTDEEKLHVIEEKLTELEARKSKVQVRIADLNARKKELLNRMQTKKIAELSKLLEETGRTPEDVINLLQPRD